MVETELQQTLNLLLPLHLQLIQKLHIQNHEIGQWIAPTSLKEKQKPYVKNKK